MFLQKKMITVEAIGAFFEKHKIPLEGEESRSPQEIDTILTDARVMDAVFEFFAARAIINFEQTGTMTAFLSYEDVEESYTHFLMGYSKHNKN